jgi:hypothetical protein
MSLKFHDKKVKITKRLKPKQGIQPNYHLEQWLLEDTYN